MSRQFMWGVQLAATAALLATFPACPPQGNGAFNQQADIKDYWPLQTGNFWQFRHPDGLHSFTYLVQEDLSTEEIGAWKVDYAYYADDPTDPLAELVYYFILRDDYFWIAYNENVMQAILDNPGMDLAPGNFLEILAPRYFPLGSNLVEFVANSVDEKRYTSTGIARDYRKSIHCPTTLQSEGSPVSLVVPETIQAVAIHEEEYCGIAQSLVAETVLGRDVGPLHRFDSRLIYAIVDGVEYVVPND